MEIIAFETKNGSIAPEETKIIQSKQSEKWPSVPPIETKLEIKSKPSGIKKLNADLTSTILNDNLNQFS